MTDSNVATSAVAEGSSSVPNTPRPAQSAAAARVARCSATSSAGQCGRIAGHRGPHIASGRGTLGQIPYQWDDDALADTPAPAVADALAEAGEGGPCMVCGHATLNRWRWCVRCAGGQASVADALARRAFTQHTTEVPHV